MKIGLTCEGTYPAIVGKWKNEALQRNPEVIAKLTLEQDRVTQESGMERVGLRYGINSASLRFIHCDNMEAESYRTSLGKAEEIR